MTKISDGVRSVAVGPSVVVAGSLDSKVRVWSVPEYKLVHEINYGDKVVAVCVLGRLLAFGGRGDHSVWVVDLGTGQQLHKLSGHGGYVKGIALDEEVVVSGSNDKTVRIWDLAYS